MKKTLTALAIAGSLTFLGAGAAQANVIGGYAPDETGTVEDSNNDGFFVVGETVTFSGSGFVPGSPIVITISNEEAGAAGAGGSAGIGGGFAAGVYGIIVPAQVITDTVNADAEGNFSFQFVPTETGTYQLTASGTGADGEPLVVSQTIKVVDPSTIGGNGSGTVTDADEAAVENGDELANTGLESSALLWGGAGVLALGAGAAAVVVSRRKNA
ncbi:LPXTG cell wall anchor domain-containing protein [Arthrobacter sp. Marseille-P9274]|uniref:LPXTG cell wall anchor domain-containing protein n=1 Tax=Arthrobacter sp. Marseille-P9274 TaxID=2866572 RepID=UPI0021C9C131|nr:LPXTG cell wall anchor domain-containing protein [Arthrobacter sp. Marseille-P9274]